MITEDYVSFETAKLLKEKGFDEITPLSYRLLDGFSQKITCRNSLDEGMVSMVTLQRAMKWLREVKNIQIEISIIGKENNNNEVVKWLYGWRIQNYTIIDRHNANFNNYEDACEGAIKYCLENLI